MPSFVAARTAVPDKDPAGQWRLVETVPFVAAHLARLAAIVTGVHIGDLLLAAALYALRIFGVTAGYQRYFSHRSYKTSRGFGFIPGFLAQRSAQRGVLWWAGTTTTIIFEARPARGSVGTRSISATIF